MCVLHGGHADLAFPADDAYASFLAELVEAKLLIVSGVPGVYGRGRDFEHVIERFDALVARVGAELAPEVMRFPPLFNRRHYEKIDHIHNFPDLMGSVHTFTGGEREHREMLGRFERREDWSRS